MQARALVEARVDADRLLLATRSALAVDGALLDASERAEIDAAMVASEASLISLDAAHIEAVSKALAQATEAFAAARMNHSIAQALAGKNIANI
jgi:molecular chaperone HscA